MAHRTFRDPAGAEWQAWDTYPATDRGRLALGPAFVAGWLCFERLSDARPEPADAAPAPSEKRRVAPVPSDWAALPDAGLQALLAAAPLVPARRSPRAVER